MRAKHDFFFFLACVNHYEAQVIQEVHPDHMICAADEGKDSCDVRSQLDAQLFAS